jgi:hypothetical protein
MLKNERFGTDLLSHLSTTMRRSFSPVFKYRSMHGMQKPVCAGDLMV